MIPQEHGTQAWDRYAYVNNSPLKYIDSSGHDPEGNCYDKGYCDKDPDYTKVYIGGGTPAEVPGFITDGPAGAKGWARLPEVTSAAEDIFEGITAGGSPTLKVYLVYKTDSDGNVTGINVVIENSGESSVTLEEITLTETELPNFTACTVNKTCTFKPNAPVITDPGQTTLVTICQNCMSDGRTVFTAPFYNNKDNLIEVRLSVSMLFSDMYTTDYISIPIYYTIPRRY